MEAHQLSRPALIGLTVFSTLTALLISPFALTYLAMAESGRQNMGVEAALAVTGAMVGACATGPYALSRRSWLPLAWGVGVAVVLGVSCGALVA